MIAFGIGLSKTGSTSLATALPVFGYQVKEKVFDLSEIEAPPSAVHDAKARFYYKITPIARSYQEVDQKFPGAKFLLTVRDMESWLKSCAHQFRTDVLPGSIEEKRRLQTWGATTFDADKFRETYRTHTEEVIEYFKNRPKDLLVMNVCDGEGWEKLCAFLGEPVPNVPFPRENVSRSPSRLLRKIKAMFRR